MFSAVATAATAAGWFTMCVRMYVFLLASFSHRSQTRYTRTLIHSLNMVKTIFDPIFHSKQRDTHCALGPKNNIGVIHYLNETCDTLGLRFSFNIIWFNICASEIYRYILFLHPQIWPMNDGLNNRFSGFYSPLLLLLLHYRAIEILNKSLALFASIKYEFSIEFCGPMNKRIRSNCILKQMQKNSLYRNSCRKRDMIREFDARQNNAVKIWKIIKSKMNTTETS